MKKTLTVLLSAFMLVAFASCMNNPNDNPAYSAQPGHSIEQLS